MLPPPRGGRDGVRGRVVQRGRLRAGDAHHPEEQLQWEMDMAPTSAHPGAAIDDVGEDRDVAVTGGVVGGSAVGGMWRHHLGQADAGRGSAVGGDGQGALAVSGADHAVGDAGAQVEGLDLEHVTRLGALDEHRAGDHVRAVGVEVAPVAVVAGGDVYGVGQDVVAADAVLTEPADRVAALVLQQALVAECVDEDGPPRPDAGGGGGVDGRHVAPCDLVGDRRQVDVTEDRPGVRLEDSVRDVPAGNRRAVRDGGPIPGSWTRGLFTLRAPA